VRKRKRRWRRRSQWKRKRASGWPGCEAVERIKNVINNTLEHLTRQTCVPLSNLWSVYLLPMCLRSWRSQGRSPERGDHGDSREVDDQIGAGGHSPGKLAQKAGKLKLRSTADPAE